RRTRGDLAPRDLRALVGLGVRAELLARGRHVRGRGTDVPVEAVEVEEKGGGGDFVAGHGADSSTPPAAPGLSIAGRVRYHLNLGDERGGEPRGVHDLAGDWSRAAVPRAHDGRTPRRPPLPRPPRAAL